MKKNIILAVGIITVTLVAGCKTGPAKTTLDPMKNVGPVSVFEERIVVENGKTNSTTFRRLESPESAQLQLRNQELKQRGQKNSGDQPYWWQGQPHYGNGGGGNYPVYSNGGYWGGTR